MTTYAPALGDWASTDGVIIQWGYSLSNCDDGTGGINIVDETITNTVTSAYYTYGDCMPNITYSQFIEERSSVSGTPAQNPEFGTHDLMGYYINTSGGDDQLSDATNRWNISIVNDEDTTLVSGSANSNHGTYSTWTDTWDSSAYP